MVERTTAGTWEHRWHTIIIPAARGFEWFVWRSVLLVYLSKLLFFGPTH